MMSGAAVRVANSCRTSSWTAQSLGISGFIMASAFAAAGSRRHSSVPVALCSYSLCSANDCPRRDPASFELMGRQAGQVVWEPLHAVLRCPFSEHKRWEWVTYDISSVTAGRTYEAVRLDISSVRRAGDGIQLGHLQFHSSDSLQLVSPLVPPAPPGATTKASRTAVVTSDSSVQLRDDVRQPPYELLPEEYKEASDAICISDRFMKNSLLRIKIEELMKSPVTVSYDIIFQAFITNAFQLSDPSQARSSRLTVPGFDGDSSMITSNYYSDCVSYYNSLSWEKPVFLTAISHITKCETSDGMKLICGLINRANLQCNARKRFVFSCIVRHCMGAEQVHLKRESDSPLASVESAKEIICIATAEYIEDAKLQALNSTFFEPTLLYCSLAGEGACLAMQTFMDFPLI